MDDITNLSHLRRQRNVGIVIRDVPSNESRVAKEKETAGGKSKGKEKVTSMGKGKENAIQLGVADKVISKASLAQRARREREKNERQYSPYQIGQRMRRERERTSERMQSRQSANPISVSPIRMGRLEDAMETTEVIQSAQRQQMLQHPFGHSTSIPSTSLAPDIIRPTSTIHINEPTPTSQLIEEDFCSDGESEDIPMNTVFHAEPQINPCRHFLGKMDVPCNDCKALHWMDERLTKSSKKHPLFGKCCLEGKIKLPNLNTPPPILQALYDGNDDQSKSFRHYTRLYNVANAFTSLGATFDDRVLGGRGTTSFTIHGELRHRTGSLLPLPALGLLAYYYKRHPLNYFLLGISTIATAFVSGLAYAFTYRKIIFEAAILPAGLVASLTLYAFWAARRGDYLNFRRHFLCGVQMVFILFLVIQIIFFPTDQRSQIACMIVAFLHQSYPVYILHLMMQTT